MLRVCNLEETRKLAALLGRFLRPGDFVALTGDLGAGKTTFTRMLCESLGVMQAVSSPTFTLLNEYYTDQGVPILHGDFYRLEDAEAQAGFPELEEMMASHKAIMLMEWADRLPQYQGDWTWRLDFGFDPETEAARQVTITAADAARLQTLLEGLNDGR